ncbi:mechanosensitive ion channel domain-containing protein [Rickettsiales bacterium LUAb2]
MNNIRYIFYYLLIILCFNINNIKAADTTSLASIPFINNIQNSFLPSTRIDKDEDSVDTLVKILKDPVTRNELINKLEQKDNDSSTKLTVENKPNKHKEDNQFSLNNSIKWATFISSKLNFLTHSDEFFINTYSDIKAYNINLINAVLKIPTDIHNTLLKKTTVNEIIDIVISVLVMLFVLFITYIIEQHVTIFVSNYTKRKKDNKIIDKVIYVGVTLLSSFIPVLVSSLLVGVLSIVGFSFTFLFFQSSVQFMLLISKLLIVWVIFRTFLIFIKRILLISFVLNFWSFVEVTYKDIRDLYSWIRRFATILLIFILSYSILPISAQLNIEILHRVLFLIFSIMLFWFLFKIKDKIQKSLILLASNTKYFYLKRLFKLLAKRFYILIIIYLFLVLRSFILSDYSSFFYVLNAVIVSAILIVIHHFLQAFGLKKINNIFAYDFEESINNIYDLNNENNMIYSSILGGKRLGIFLENAYYYSVLAIFCLFVLQAWGVHTTTVLENLLNISIIKITIEILLSLLSILILSIVLFLLVRQKVVKLDLDKNFEAVNKWLSMISLLNKPYIFFCIILFIFEILIISEVPIINIVVGSGVVILVCYFIIKDIIRNFLGALMCILEDIFSINDYVKIGSHEGTVENISSTYVKLRDREGNLHIIPFASIDTVINTTNTYSYAYNVITVSDSNNIDEVIQILQNVSSSLIKDINFSILIKEPLKLKVNYDVNNKKVSLSCKIKTYPAKQFEVSSEFLKRVKLEFDKAEVKLYEPYSVVKILSDSSKK